MELFMQGIVLMVVGMATVFIFLMLLVLAMQVSAAFFRKYAHLFPEESQQSSGSTAVDPAVQVAIAVAAIKAKRG